MADRDSFSDHGYFGPAHPDCLMAQRKSALKSFVARFKHALLFTPKLVLADHMALTPNFELAYREDPEFRFLLREDLVDIAHFEKFNNGGPFTLVELRKFRTYLQHGQSKHYDPRLPSCPSHPFDVELEAIQANVGRRYPEGANRDPLFTSYADELDEQQTLGDEFGDFFTIYRTAYRKMRADCAAQGVPLGIIHFDQTHGMTERDIFDYMAEIPSLGGVPRERLVEMFGDKIAGAYRTLLIKAEIRLMSGVHAILPADLTRYRTLALIKVDGDLIDEKEANIREEKINLSAIHEDTLSTLTFQEIQDIRKSGKDFFETFAESYGNPKQFDLLWKVSKEYCQTVNDRLAYKPVPEPLSRRVEGKVRVIQGKLAKHKGLVDGLIATSVKIVSNVGHTVMATQTGMTELGSMIDAPLQAAEHALRSALNPAPLTSMIKDVKARMVLVENGESERLMHYD
jgi:hypothetical protein